MPAGCWRAINRELRRRPQDAGGGPPSTGDPASISATSYVSFSIIASRWRCPAAASPTRLLSARTAAVPRLRIAWLFPHFAVGGRRAMARARRKARSGRSSPLCFASAVGSAAGASAGVITAAVVRRRGLVANVRCRATSPNLARPKASTSHAFVANRRFSRSWLQPAIICFAQSTAWVLISLRAAHRRSALGALLSAASTRAGTLEDAKMHQVPPALLAYTIARHRPTVARLDDTRSDRRPLHPQRLDPCPVCRLS